MPIWDPSRICVRSFGKYVCSVASTNTPLPNHSGQHTWEISNELLLSFSYTFWIQETSLTVTLQHSIHLATALPALMMPSDMWHMGHRVRRAPNCPPELLPSAGTRRGSSPFLDWRLSRVKYRFFYLHFRALGKGLTVFKRRLLNICPFT